MNKFKVNDRVMTPDGPGRIEKISTIDVQVMLEGRGLGYFTYSEAKLTPLAEVGRIIKYGLRVKNTQKVLVVFPSANSPDSEAVSITYELYSEDFTGSIWMVDKKEIAEKAKISTEWYNADYSTPKHKFQPEELEVVIFQIEVI
jgi:hypothetical protein